MARTELHISQATAPHTGTRSASHDKDRVFRIMTRAVCVLLALILGLVSWARLTDRPLEAVRPFTPVAEAREIVLISDTSGRAVVRDPDGAVLIELGPGEGGFLHTMWRAVQRERTRHRVPQDSAILVARHDNGRMSLHDPATDLRVDLTAFGKSNAAAFEAVLEY
ncbi:MAG: photosynthetic complex assembly protein PuhC [Pseudomonadota bacterium]